MLNIAAWVSVALLTFVYLRRLTKAQQVINEMLPLMVAGKEAELKAMTDRSQAETNQSLARVFGPVLSLAAISLCIADWYTNGIWAPFALGCLAFIGSCIAMLVLTVKTAFAAGAQALTNLKETTDTAAGTPVANDNASNNINDNNGAGSDNNADTVKLLTDVSASNVAATPNQDPAVKANDSNTDGTKSGTDGNADH